MESDNLSCEQVSSALTSAGIGNHAVRPQNGRLFPLTANSDHGSTDNAGNSVNLVSGIIRLPSGRDFSVCTGDRC